MKYPRMNNVLTFSEKEDGSFFVKNNLNEEKWVISKECKMFLEQLDGHTNPYMILKNVPRSEVRAILKQYEKQGLLFKYRLRILNLFSYMYAVFIPNFNDLEPKEVKNEHNDYVLVITKEKMIVKYEYFGNYTEIVTIFMDNICNMPVDIVTKCSILNELLEPFGFGVRCSKKEI